MMGPDTDQAVSASSPEPDTDGRAVEPRRSGELARWRLLYDVMFKLRPGDLITYVEMADLLGLDITVAGNKAMVHGALRKAADELLARHKMVFHLVRGRGYQVARPGQVIEVAREHQARAFAEIESGHTKIEAVDLSQVDTTTARLIEATAMGFSRQTAMMRQFDVRQKRLETAMVALAETAYTAVNRAAETATRVDANDADLAELRQRVAELEAQRNSG
jgi:hypothetical protein